MRVYVLIGLNWKLSMPATVVVRARVDESLVQEVEAVLAAIGLTASDAVRLLMMRIAQDKTLPFEPIVLKHEPTPERRRNMSNIVTPQMRQHAISKTHDHFGFSGYRAAIACLYARPEGATQAEANQAAHGLDSTQSGYFNMLRQARNKWKHDVVVWEDPKRGGRVYKLVFNPNHSAPRAVDPPSNWRAMNVAATPLGAKPKPYKPNEASPQTDESCIVPST
jgi:addiction module RelB/DinJ family antitoxin